MNSIRKSFTLKIISVILVIAFINLDIAWAYPDRAPQNHTLAVPIMNSGTPFTAHEKMISQMKRFKVERLGALWGISRCLFGRDSASYGKSDGFDLEPLSFKHFAQQVPHAWGKVVEGIDIENIVPLDHWEKMAALPPGAAQEACCEDFLNSNPTMTEDDVLVIPYKVGKDKVRRVVLVAKRNNDDAMKEIERWPSCKALMVADEPMLEAYALKQLVWDYEEKKLVVEEPETVDEKTIVQQPAVVAVVEEIDSVLPVLENLDTVGVVQGKLVIIRGKTFTTKIISTLFAMFFAGKLFAGKSAGNVATESGIQFNSVLFYGGWIVGATILGVVLFFLLRPKFFPDNFNIRRLGSKKQSVRLKGVRGLGGRKTVKAVDALIEALGDRDKKVSAEAFKALVKTGKPALLKLGLAMNNFNSHGVIPIKAAEVVGEIGYELSRKSPRDEEAYKNVKDTLVRAIKMSNMKISEASYKSLNRMNAMTTQVTLAMNNKRIESWANDFKSVKYGVNDYAFRPHEREKLWNTINNAEEFSEFDVSYKIKLLRLLVKELRLETTVEVQQSEAGEIVKRKTWDYSKVTNLLNNSTKLRESVYDAAFGILGAGFEPLEKNQLWNAINDAEELSELYTSYKIDLLRGVVKEKIRKKKGPDGKFLTRKEWDYLEVETLIQSPVKLQRLVYDAHLKKQEADENINASAQNVVSGNAKNLLSTLVPFLFIFFSSFTASAADGEKSPGVNWWVMGSIIAIMVVVFVYTAKVIRDDGSLGWSQKKSLSGVEGKIKSAKESAGGKTRPKNKNQDGKGMIKSLVFLVAGLFSLAIVSVNQVRLMVFIDDWVLFFRIFSIPILIATGIILYYIAGPAVRQIKSLQIDRQNKRVEKAIQKQQKVVSPKFLDGKVRKLIKALGDENEAIRVSAENELVKIGEPAMTELIEALGNDYLWIQDNAIKVLVRLKKIAVPALIKALKEGNNQIKANAALVLAKIRDKKSIFALIEAMGDEDLWVQAEAEGALIKIGYPVVSELQNAIKSEKRTIRRGAAKVLKRLNSFTSDEEIAMSRAEFKEWAGQVKAIPELKIFAFKDEQTLKLSQLIKNKNESDLLKIVINNLRTEKIVEWGDSWDYSWDYSEVIRLADNPAELRELIDEALKKQMAAKVAEVKESREPWAEKTKPHPFNANESLRAVIWIAMIAGLNSILLPTLMHTDTVVMLGTGMFVFGNKQKTYALFSKVFTFFLTIFSPVRRNIWLAGSKNVYLRRWGVEVLGESSDERAVAALIRALKDEDDLVKEKAVFSLLRIGELAFNALAKEIETEGEYEGSNAEVFCSTLSKGDVWKQEQVWGTMKEIGKPAVPILMKLLRDSKDSILVRANAAYLLGKIGDERAVPALIEALGDEAPRVQHEAYIALKEGIGKRAIPLLKKELENKDSLISGEISKILREMGETTVKGLKVEEIPTIEYGQETFVQPDMFEDVNKNGNGETPTVEYGQEKLIQPDMIKEAKTQDEIEKLFDVIEECFTNRRDKRIADGNDLIGRLNYISFYKEDAPIKTEKIKADMLTAEIRERLEKVVLQAESEKYGKHEDISALAEKIKKELDQLEADSVVSSSIILAREALNKKTVVAPGERKQVIALEIMHWIPGYWEKALGNGKTGEHDVMNTFIQEIIALGVENVEIVFRQEGESLESWSKRIVKASGDQKADLSNVLVFGSQKATEYFDICKMTGFKDSKRAFLAGIDQERLKEMSECYKENKASDELLVIEMTKMLSIALELATGKIAPDMDIIKKGSYNSRLRKVMFLPRMDVMEYTELKQHYKAKRKALIAA